MRLLPIDWETAGWGLPAADVPLGDIMAYWAVVREHWPRLDLHTIQRLADVGQIFRWLAAISWESLYLTFPQLEWPMIRLREYHAGLANAIQAVEWAE
jgi:hypothetical protein